MTAVGQKRTFMFMDLVQSERPVSGKADVPCCHDPSANAGELLTFELRLVYGSDKAKPTRKTV